MRSEKRCFSHYYFLIDIAAQTVTAQVKKKNNVKKKVRK